MDNLTHSLVGLMMSRAGLNRGERGSAAMIVVAANIPDVDGYPFFYDPLRYLQVHRGYPHALVFAPVMAMLAIAVVKLTEKGMALLHQRGYTWNAFLTWANLQNASVRRGIKTKTDRDYTIGSYFYLWFVCTLAVLSHLVLDWTNVYGIQ
jgi:inner membrane protein